MHMQRNSIANDAKRHKIKHTSYNDDQWRLSPWITRSSARTSSEGSLMVTPGGSVGVRNAVRGETPSVWPKSLSSPLPLRCDFEEDVWRRRSDLAFFGLTLSKWRSESGAARNLQRISTQALLLHHSCDADLRRKAENSLRTKRTLENVIFTDQRCEIRRLKWFPETNFCRTEVRCMRHWAYWRQTISTDRKNATEFINVLVMSL